LSKLKKKLKTGAASSAPVVFLTTFANREDAVKFATTVVKEKLAACVNIIEGVTSIYIWQKKEQREQEILAIGKTTAKVFKKLKAKIKTLHPHELPELIALPISDGMPAYLEWLTKEVN